MENQKQNNMDQSVQRNRWGKYLIGISVALMTVFATYLVHTNPKLGLADLTNVGQTGSSNDYLYMPSYTAGIGESGLIEIKTKEDIATSFDSITFSLDYTPVSALIFENNPIVFDADTEFQSAAFQMTASPEDGKLIVTIILEDSITINPGTIDPATEATHRTLFKLDTELNASIPEGQVIDVTFDDLALLNGADPVILPDMTMPASTITVAGQNELKVLNAQALDSTHVAIEFSDYLSDLGNTAAYAFDPDPTVTLVESGVNYGFSQKFVVLTTGAQTPGDEYTITVDPLSSITSNQQGSIDSAFSNVIFYGFGQGAGVLSDFQIESVQATGYKTMNVTFSDPVRAASVTKNDFALNIQGGGAVTIDNVSNISGSQVTLSVSDPLLKSNTYVLSAVTPTSILRDSDGVGLGIDRTAFAGYKNGPRLIGATVTDINGTYRLQLTFDEEIELGGVVDNPVGTIFTTGTTPGTEIDDSNYAIYNQAISGFQLTIDNAIFNDPDENFVFSVSTTGWLTNSLGVPVDQVHNGISFWGLGHSNSLNTVGTVQVTKKDAILIPPGTLDFNEVETTDVSVLIDIGGSLSSETISSVGLVNNNLEVTLGTDIDPDIHYFVRIVDNAVDDNTLVAKSFVVERALDVISAQALSNTQVRVFFSENIDERDVDQTDFSVNDGGIAVTGLTIDPGYQSVTLDTAGTFTAGDIFKVTATGFSDVYSYEGDALLKNTTFFTGYQTQSAESPVTLDSVEVVSAQKLRLNFSDALDESSFTPVNFDVFWFSDPLNPATRDDLVVTNLTKIDNDTYELSTAIQDAGQNYFIIFDGVEDANDLRLANAKVKNFFGFQLPEVEVTLITPNTLSNDLDTNIVLSGDNLDIVKEVRLGNEPLTILNQSKTSLTFLVPANFTADIYDLVLIDEADNSNIFNNAVVVTLPSVELIVHSDQSRAIPLNVPNDGATSTKLWLLIEDPVGLADVDSVVIDLSQIGGSATAEMTKDPGTQPQFGQWYTYQTTVPATIQTQDEPYKLPVEVRKGTTTFDGTVSVRVTKDVQASVAPVVDQAYVSPVSVAPNETTPIKISAQVTDQDGAATITSVVADLGALGIGFLPLEPVGEVTEGAELETQYFQTEFTMPEATEEGNYLITLTASDATGEKGTKTVSLQVSNSASGPKFDSNLSYVSPRNAIPRDGKTEFSIHTFVSDRDGAADIQSVVANFGRIGIAPVALSLNPETGAAGEGAWYQATGLTIPKTASLGSQEIQVVATDSSGGLASMTLQIDVTHKDTLGDPPRVVDDRAYTSPRSATNDGETPITLYAFVEDHDDDIESVVVNLSDVGQVGSYTDGTLGGGDTTEPSDGSCPTGSNVLVCMTPSVKEGIDGRWFILPGVTVNPMTTPSPHPYQVEVIATDAGGKTTRGTIPVYVGGGGLGDDQQPPKGLAAIATSETTIEVLFSKEISANSLSSSGRAFTVTSLGDVSDVLPVVGATINSAGTVVTLSTANQMSGEIYSLSISNEIKDLTGRGVVEGAANRLNFTGFEALNQPPILEYVQSTDVDMVELEFRHNLKPSSVRTGISQADASEQFGVRIYEADNTSKRLDVLGVKLLGPGNIMQITTGPQVAEMRYRINLEGLQSYDGTPAPGPINKGFIGYNLAVVHHAANANLADLDGDGDVDFADFTIFSSVYGTIYFGANNNVVDAAANAAAQAAAAANQAGQPLDSNNATVPTTSIPAGGAIQ